MFTEEILNQKMIQYCKKNGVNIRKERKSPTMSAAEMTDIFTRFFNDSNSGLSASKGTYNADGEPVWQAQVVQGASVVSRCD